MQRTALILALLLVPAAAAGPVVSFVTPGQFDGGVEADDAMWALIYFHDADASFSAVLHDAQHTNHSLSRAEARVVLPTGDQWQHRTSDRAVASEGDSWDALFMEIGFGGGWSSLYVMADRLQVSLGRGTGSIVAADGGAPEWYVPADEDVPPLISRSSVHRVPEGSVAFGMSPGDVPVDLQAWGVRELEWHNATTSCPPPSCPDGARATQQHAEHGESGVRVKRAHYAQVESAGGLFSGSGTAYMVVVGGAGANVMVNGSIRLPDARAPDCACRDPDGSTLLASGLVSFSNLSVPAPERVEATLGGDVASLRFDERAVATSWLGDRGAVVVMGAAVALAPFLAWLFTRISKTRASTQPTRQCIHRYIQDHPGATFGQIAEATGVSDGSLSYNFKVLRHCGLVVGHAFLNRTHYFTPRDVPDDPDRWLLQRDADHAWLLQVTREHPDATQTDLSRHARARGVGRTAMQKRLGRLVQHGLLLQRKEGRRVWYEPTES